MFNSSLKQAVEEKKEPQAFEEMDIDPESKLQKKLIEEDQENYEKWINSTITHKVFVGLEKEIEINNERLLRHCLGTGIDRPVEDRRVLYYSLKNKVIKEMLKLLKGD